MKSETSGGSLYEVRDFQVLPKSTKETFNEEEVHFLRELQLA